MNRREFMKSAIAAAAIPSTGLLATKASAHEKVVDRASYSMIDAIRVLSDELDKVDALYPRYLYLNKTDWKRLIDELCSETAYTARPGFSEVRVFNIIIQKETHLTKDGRINRAYYQRPLPTLHHNKSL